MNLKRINEIAERKSAILKEIDGADAETLTALEAEVDELDVEERSLKQKVDLEERIGKSVSKPEKRGEKMDQREERATKFAQSDKTSINARALLLSGGKIAQKTEVAEQINDIYGTEVSSIVDLITVTDCTGMGVYRVPYQISGLTATAKTEGEAPTSSDAGFGYVDLTPNAFNVLSYVSKQIKKQSPLMYEAKVIQAARTALRKKASKVIVDAIYAQVKEGGLCASKEYAKSTTTGQAIGEKTLRDIAFAYGGEEGIGGGVLVLNKNDLIAFGDVRGANEKKAVYEITPDAANENTGIIKDGGLSVKYVINSNCAEFHGNKTASAKTMIYGNPKNVEMATWGDIEVATSEDYKFAESLLAVLGETLLDADVVVKNGFVVVTTGA